MLDLSFFLFISSDSCHKKMLLESLNIPLKCSSTCGLQVLEYSSVQYFSLRITIAD